MKKLLITLCMCSLVALMGCEETTTSNEEVKGEPVRCTTTTTTVTTTGTTTTTTETTSTTTTTTTATTTTTTAAVIATEAPCTEPPIITEAPTIAVPTETTPTTSELPITEQEYILISNVISHEAGCSWIGEYERACIVAAIMNRVADSRFPNTIDEVVHQPGQMFDVPYYRVDYSGLGYEPIDNAIYAYFNGTYSFDYILYWTGDGRHNYFR